MQKYRDEQNREVAVLTFEIRCNEDYVPLEAFIMLNDLTLELSVIITGDI